MVHLALLAGLLALSSTQVSAVEWSLFTTNVTMMSGRTFQMPLTASDPQGAPLTFSIVSISDTNLTAVIAPTNSRSLLMNVSGVDVTNAPFTGNIVLQLYEDLTPLTTARIIELVDSGFYNGLTFHRVIQNFVAQGGDPSGNGTGGTGTKFDDEFVASLIFSGFGQLAMANSGDDSNDSQFFITDVDLTFADGSRLPPSHLNFNHTIFGQMTSGFDVLAKIIETPVNGSDAPLTPVIINSATTFTNTQAAVLRLSAAEGFTGTADVTVSATDTNSVSVEQTFQVNVIANTVNSAAFLGPVPASVTTTQNIPVSFTLAATDIDNDPMTVTVVDPNTGVLPIQLTSATFDTNASQLTLTPSMTFTGVLNLVVQVKDSAHPNDTQHFSLTVLPCTASLDSAGDSFPTNGGNGLVTVTAAGTCPWYATTTNSWIGITQGSGIGSNTVQFIVATNHTGVVRIGKLVIAGHPYLVTQDGVGCAYALGSSGTNHTAAAGSGSFNVITAIGCVWSASTTDTWIHTTSSNNISGNVNYTVDANIALAPRAGSISVQDQTFTVTQDAATCAAVLSTNAVTVAATGTNATVNVLINTNCDWTATSNDSWITVDSGTNGTGNGTVGYSVDGNPTLAQRVGTLLIAGNTFTVTQTSNTVDYSQITGAWDTTLDSSLKVSGVLKASRFSSGQSKLYPDGTFDTLEQLYGSTPIMSGTYSPDAKGKSVLSELTPAGQARLRQFLLTWLAEAAVANSITLSNPDLTFTKLKIGKTKIATGGQLGKQKITVSGSFTGTVNGSPQTGSFSSNILITFGQKNSL